MVGLGSLYGNGTGVDQDLEKAAALFRSAAEAGEPHAMFNLALIHLKGGVADPMHPSEVMALLQTAADLGLADAGYQLGGWLATMDRHAEALEWYLRAAAGGHGSAMFEAAARYRDGVGTDPDPVQAVRWFLSMLDVGDSNGVHEAIQLARSMTEEQINQASDLAGREADAHALISVAHRHP